jgi:hypothetical protein
MAEQPPRRIQTAQVHDIGAMLRNLQMEVKQVNAGDEVISRGPNQRGRAMFSGFEVSFGSDKLGWGPTREKAIEAFNHLIQNYLDKAHAAGIPLTVHVPGATPTALEVAAREVVASADNTGCTEDLTVVSQESVDHLVTALGQ